MIFDFSSIKFDYNSPVIITYLIISMIACFLNYLTRGKSNKLLFSSYRSSLFNPLTYIRLFTHSIGHKDWSHLVSNFVFILLIGPMIEEKYGSMNLLIMFLVTSLVIGIFNSLFSKYVIMGSSGNVYMLIVLSSFSNITEGRIPLTLILVFIFFISHELKDSILEGNSKIYHSGHLIGALCGIIFGFLLYYNESLLNLF